MSTRRTEQAPPEGYSCPYRKVDPEEFSKARHPSCASDSFPTIQKVVEHVKAHHELYENACSSCGLTFPTRADLVDHSQRRRGTCADLEGGLAAAYDTAARVKADWPDTWVALWAKLFGAHSVPKSPGFQAPWE